MKFRFHILGVPHTVSSTNYNACAFTQKIVKFGKMMTQRGHTVIHYGHEDSDLICTEHVTVLTNQDFDKVYGTHDWKSTFFKYNTQDEAYLSLGTMESVGKLRYLSRTLWVNKRGYL